MANNTSPHEDPYRANAVKGALTPSKIVMMNPYWVAYVRLTTASTAGAIGHAMGDGFAKVMGALQSAGIAPSGPPLAAYHHFDDTETTFDVCLPIPKESISAVIGVKTIETLGGEALRFVHKGPYGTLEHTYAVAMAELEAAGLTLKSPSYEIYVNDPGETPEDRLMTEILMPIERRDE
ncbi:MAG: GyrI-like domain-containing protein [Pseudomonadota bacterium]